jgi:hypothetical protein
MIPFPWFGVACLSVGGLSMAASGVWGGFWFSLGGVVFVVAGWVDRCGGRDL